MNILGPQGFWQPPTSTVRMPETNGIGCRRPEFRAAWTTSKQAGSAWVEHQAGGGDIFESEPGALEHRYLVVTGPSGVDAAD
jgi:hypothetical protein